MVRQKFSKKMSFVFAALIVLFLSFGQVKALNYIKNSDFVCTETEEYKKWKLLPEEEKANAMVPVMCEETVSLGGFSDVNLGVTLSGIDSSHVNDSRFHLGNVDGKSYLTPAKDQTYSNRTTNNDSMMCWAFATNAAVESAYLLSGATASAIFSEKHIAYSASRELEDGTKNLYGYYAHTNVNGVDSGGSYFMSGTYLAQRRGPVLENDLPFSTAHSKASYLNLAPYLTVKNVYYFMGDENSSCSSHVSTIKRLLVKYGAIAGSMRGDAKYAFSCASGKCQAFYYGGNEGPTHGIAIVGWDDNYSASNFTGTNYYGQSVPSQSPPAGNGAWIIKDTYKDLFTISGDSKLGDGYHYMSYYDTASCYLLAYLDGMERGNDYTLYTHDRLGFANAISNNASNTIYFRQQYQKKSSKAEQIKDVTLFGIDGDNYEIYYSKDGTFHSENLIASGTFDSFGYRSVGVTATSVTSDFFYIYVKYVSNSTDGHYWVPVFLSQMATEQDNHFYIDTYDKGVSFYSLNTPDQMNSTTDFMVDGVNRVMFPNIYVFTTAYTPNNSLSSGDPQASGSKVTPTSGYYLIPLYMSGDITLSDITVKIYEKGNNSDVTSKFNVKSYTESNAEGFKISSKDATPGDYTVKFSYGELSDSETITISADDVPVADDGLSSGNPQPSRSRVTTNGGYYYIPLTISGMTLSDITVKVYDVDNNNSNATTKFNIASYKKGFKISSKDATPGNYSVKFSYNELSSTENIVIYSDASADVGDEILATKIEILGLDEVSVNGTLDLEVSLDPKNVTSSNVEWNSSDDSVAIVTDSGIVVGVKAGTATITATTIDGSNLTAKKKITVIDINLEQGEGVTQPVPITIPTSNEDNDPIETDKVSNPETGSSLIFILLIGLFGAMILGYRSYKNQRGEI